MATFKRFEEIEAWQKARELVREIYVISEQGQFARDFVLRDQIRRAGISIMSNIAEGFERDGRREFIQFLAIAKGSAAEVRAQLYIALDQNYITRSVFEKLTCFSEETGKIIGGLMRYLEQSDLKGQKYK
ncbi:MAG: four helix bundle protein [Nitrosomonadales bacterium]|nr:four helix bundle protein [Nitrosomonadales bacterium]